MCCCFVCLVCDDSSLWLYYVLRVVAVLLCLCAFSACWLIVWFECVCVFVMFVCVCLYMCRVVVLLSLLCDVFCFLVYVRVCVVNVVVGLCLFVTPVIVLCLFTCVSVLVV